MLSRLRCALIGWLLLAGLLLPATAQQGTATEEVVAAGLRNLARIETILASSEAAVSAPGPILEAAAKLEDPSRELALETGERVDFSSIAIPLSDLQQQGAGTANGLLVVVEASKLHRPLLEALAGLAQRLPMGHPDRAELAVKLDALIGIGVTYQTTLGAIPFPASPTERITLGALLADHPARWDTLAASWTRLDGAQIDLVTGQLHQVWEVAAERWEADRAVQLAFPEFAEVFGYDWTILPSPSGQANVALLRQQLTQMQSFGAELARLAQLRDRVAGNASEPAPSVGNLDAKREQLRAAQSDGDFTEPLQLPPPNPWTTTPWWVRLLSSLIRRLNIGPVNGSLAGIISTVVLGLLAGILIAFLLRLLITRSGDRFAGDTLAERLRAGRSLDMEHQFALALAALEQGDLGAAWHWLMQGFIVGLAQRKLVTLDWSKTNREYVRELQGASAATYVLARRFFGTADGVVYGGQECSPQQVREFHDLLLAHLRT